MVAVGFIPRFRVIRGVHRGATPDFLRWFQASLRDANALGARVPWLESHGYHRAVAPRLRAMPQRRSLIVVIPVHGFATGFQLARLPSIAIWKRNGSMSVASFPSGRMTQTGRLSAGFSE